MAESNLFTLDDVFPTPQTTDKETQEGVFTLDDVFGAPQQTQQETFTQEQAFASPLEQPDVEDAGFFRSVGDVGLGIGQGVLTITDAVATAFAGADSDLSKGISSAKGYLAELLSAEGKQDAARAAQILKEAEDAGVLDGLWAGVRAVAADPSGMISQGVGSLVPFLAANLLTGGGATGAVALGSLGATSGAGIVKESIYDAVKNELMANGESEAKAEKIAAQAQSYGGDNLDQILLGGGLGIFASLGPAEKLGFNKALKGNIAKRMGIKSLEEAIPEAIQAGQEQAAANIALQREGFDVDTFRGVTAQATAEGIIGGILGAPAGIARAPDDPDKFVEDAGAEEDVEAIKALVNESQKVKSGQPEATDETDDLQPDTGGVEPSVPTPDGQLGEQPTTVSPAEPAVGGVEPAPSGVDDVGVGEGDVNTALALATRLEEAEAELAEMQTEFEGASAQVQTDLQTTEPEAQDMLAKHADLVAAKDQEVAQLRQQYEAVQQRLQPKTAETVIERTTPEGETTTETRTGPATDAELGIPAKPTKPGRRSVQDIDVEREAERVNKAVDTPKATQRTKKQILQSAREMTGRVTRDEATAQELEAEVERIRTTEGEDAANMFADEAQKILNKSATDKRQLKVTGKRKPKSKQVDEPAADAQDEAEIRNLAKRLMDAQSKAAEDTDHRARKRGLKAAATRANKQLFEGIAQFYGRELDPEDRIAVASALMSGQPLPDLKAKTVAPEVEPELNPETGLENPGKKQKNQGGRPKMYEGEQAEQRAAERTQDSTARMTLQRAVERAVEVLSTPTLDMFKAIYGETNPAVQDAETLTELLEDVYNGDVDALRDDMRIIMDIRASRIADAFRVLKNTTVGAKTKAKQLAKDIVEDTGGKFDIAPEERARAEQMAETDPELSRRSRPEQSIEDRAAPPQAQLLGDTTNDTVDRTFEGFNTARAALDHIIETGTAFEKLLARRIRKAVGNVQIRIVRNLEDIPPRLRSSFEGRNAARGVYVHKSEQGNIVYLNDINGRGDGLTNTIILHELFHAATEGLIGTRIQEIEEDSENYMANTTRRALQQLTVVMDAARKVYLEREQYGLTTAREDRLYALGAFDDLREFVAYGFTQPEMQTFLTTVPGIFATQEAKNQNLFGRFVDLVRKMFNIPDNVSTAFLDLVALGDQIVDAPFIDMSEGILLEANSTQGQKKQKDVDRKILNSNTGNQFRQGMGQSIKNSFRNWAQMKSLLVNGFESMDVGRVFTFAKAATADQLADWASSVGMGKIAEVNNIIQKKMVPYKDQILADLHQKVKEWEAFNTKYPKLIQAFVDMLHYATLTGVDPASYADVDDALQTAPDLIEARNNLQTAINNNDSAGRIRGLRANVTKIENTIRDTFERWENIKENSESVTRKRPKRDKNLNIIKDANGKPVIETVTMPEAQFLYEMIRNKYRDTYVERKKLLRAQVENSGLSGDPNDPSTPLGKALAGLEETFAKADKVKVYFPLMRQGKHWVRIGRGKNKIFAMFEDRLSRDMYIDNMVEQMRANGEASTKQELEEMGFIAKGDDTRNFQTELMKISPGDQGAAILRQIDNQIAGATNLSQKEIEALRNNIFQMYLMTLPDRDIRKRFSPRKGTAGFSGDGLRNFIISELSAANQLSRMKYSSEIRLRLGEAEELSKIGSNAAQRGVLFREFAQRVEDEMLPEYDESIFQKLAGLGNQAAFIMMLTSIKSALVQFTQLPIVGTNVLAAEYGYTKTFGMMGNYALLFNKLGTSKIDPVTGEMITQWGQPSVGDSKYAHKKPHLRKAWEWAHNLNMFQQTYSADLGGAAKEPTANSLRAGNRISRGVYNLMTGAFFHSERLSREVMYMSAFEMEYDKQVKAGKSADEAQELAQEKAYELTKEALFNYSQFNKPPIMKKYAISRLAFQFMTYTQQMVVFLMKNLYQMIRLEPTMEGRIEASQKFMGTLIATTLFAGIPGLPLYSVVTGTINAFREMERPDEEDDEMRALMYDMDDSGNPLGLRDIDLWFRTWWIPNTFGPGSDMAKFMGLSDKGAILASRSAEMGLISALTGMNIGSSTSLDSLFFNSDTIGRDSRTALQEYAYTQLFGPVGSMALSFIDGYQDIANGDINRGAEKFMPAAIRGAIKSLRLTEEGELTRKGAEVRNREYFTQNPEKIVGQVLGFADTEVAQQQKRNILAKRVEIAIKEERGKVLADLDRSVQKYNNNPTDARFESIIEDLRAISRYNYKNFMLPINNETISKSLKGRAERRAAAMNGLIVDKNTAPFLFDMIMRGM